MDLYQIDHMAVSGRSWLHRLPAAAKLLALAALIAVLLWLHTVVPMAVALGLVLVAAVSARLPWKTFVALAVYPLFFLLILFVSTRGLTVVSAALLTTRVLAITGAVILYVLTTPYPDTFAALSRVLPAFLTAALFFTYRSLLVISDSLNNARIALHTRGAVDWRRPISTVRQFGLALGHTMVNSIDASERMAEALVVRGFANRVYSLGRKNRPASGGLP